MPKLRNAQSYARTADKACAWLKTQFDDSKTSPCDIAPLKAYQKVPFLFAASGLQDEARNLLSHVKNELLDDTLGLLTAPAKQGGIPAPVSEQAWIATAAQVTGRFCLSRKIIDGLLLHQGPRTGGFYDVVDGARKTTADVRTTACAALALLYAGRYDAARLAGGFLAAAVQQQTESERFFVRLDSMARVVTHIPKGESADYVIGRAKGRVEFSFLGLPIIFLTKLYLATEESEWLEAAMDYFVIAENYGREIWTGLDIGTLGWGAAALYDITRRRFYYDAADGIALSLNEQFTQDGRWPARPATDIPATIWATAEGALTLMEAAREAQ
jgi:hypothetical protein